MGPIQPNKKEEEIPKTIGQISAPRRKTFFSV
jgi:hypothetical protein